MKDKPQAVQSSQLDNIIRGLSQKPAYLLMFSVSLLIFGIGSSSSLFGVIAKVNGATYGGLAVAAIALIVTAVVVVKVDTVGSLAPSGAVGDKALEPVFSGIHGNIRNALNIQQPVFHSWLVKECSAFRATTRLWSQG